MLLPATIMLPLLVPLSPPLSPQTFQALPIPGPVKDAGVYHVATGTWTRDHTQENLGSKVLYSNLANTGFFGVMAVQSDILWTDEGRIPSKSGHPNADADAYHVDGFQIGYCPAVVGPIQMGITFYECYASCTNPLNSPPLEVLLFTAPGAPACWCWIVTFDLHGTSHEFTIGGDGEGTFDGTSALDNFGWTLYIADQGSGGFNGPLLNGHPNNVPYGDGTYYQNSGAWSSTGLGTVDQFWLTDAQGNYSNGCYWFGGYPGTNIFASFWFVLFGESAESGLFTPYCTANPNSTGAPADLSGAGTSATAGDIVLTSQPVPAQAGVFFHGATQSQIPFGNGYLCATDNLRRGAIVIGGSTGCGALCASYVYDNSDPEHALGPFVGAARNFQHWYRDPTGGGAFFNTSNAVSATIPP